MIVTQKMIAEMAGVSQKTVSLYFKGSPKVAKKTREKLSGIVEKYNYFPNLAARSMKSRSFKRIAILIVDHGRHKRPAFQQYSSQHLLYYTQVLAGEFAKAGYSLVLEPIDIDFDTMDLCSEPNFFKTRSVDAIIGLMGGFMPLHIDEKIRQMGVPVLWINRKSAPGGIPYLYFDEVANGRLMAEYLIRKGRTNIAWIGMQVTNQQLCHYSMPDRLEGVRQVCRENGANLIEFNRGETDIYKIVRDISKLKEIDGVVCYVNSFMRIVAYELMRQGRTCPEDVDIVGIVNAKDLYDLLAPYFSHLLLPEYEMACNGAAYILQALSGKTDSSLLKPLTGHIIPCKPPIVSCIYIFLLVIILIPAVE